MISVIQNDRKTIVLTDTFLKEVTYRMKKNGHLIILCDSITILLISHQSQMRVGKSRDFSSAWFFSVVQHNSTKKNSLSGLKAKKGKSY